MDIHGQDMLVMVKFSAGLVKGFGAQQDLQSKLVKDIWNKMELGNGSK